MSFRFQSPCKIWGQLASMLRAEQADKVIAACVRIRSGWKLRASMEVELGHSIHVVHPIISLPSGRSGDGLWYITYNCITHHNSDIGWFMALGLGHSRYSRLFLVAPKKKSRTRDHWVGGLTGTGWGWGWGPQNTCKMWWWCSLGDIFLVHRKWAGNMTMYDGKQEKMGSFQLKLWGNAKDMGIFHWKMQFLGGFWKDWKGIGVRDLETGPMHRQPAVFQQAMTQLHLRRRQGLGALLCAWGAWGLIGFERVQVRLRTACRKPRLSTS